MNLHLNFTDKLYVSSSSDQDKLDIIVRYNSLFKAKSDEHELEKNYKLRNILVPKLTGSQKEFEKVKGIMDTVSGSIYMTLVVPVVFQVVKSVSMDSIWPMFNALQYEANFINLDKNIGLETPANAQFLFQTMREVSYFEPMQNPHVKLALQEHIFGKNSKLQKLLFDLGEVPLLLFTVILIMGLAFVMNKVFKDSERKEKVVKKIKESVMWSGVFRGQIQMYLPACLQAQKNIYLIIFGSEVLDA